MPQGLNKVLLIGYLGTDPEMRFTPMGKPITTFSIIASRDDDGVVNQIHKRSELFTILVWGELAEICKDTLQLGNKVYIDGQLQTRNWIDDQGCSKSDVEIVANEVLVLEKIA